MTHIRASVYFSSHVLFLKSFSDAVTEGDFTRLLATQRCGHICKIGPLSIVYKCSDVWSTVHTEVTLKPNVESMRPT